MKKEITLGNLLAIVIPLVMVLLTWGISVETRIQEHSIRISNNEKTNVKNEQRLMKIEENTVKILVELQNKKDKDK
jgi:hypothetical protein